MDRLIDDVLSAQEPSGYLNTYWVEERKALRFTELVRSHEEYCLGHLLQAGIAYLPRHRQPPPARRRDSDGGLLRRATSARRSGPCSRDIRSSSSRWSNCTRTTGERKYLEFAGYLLSRLIASG